MKVLFFARLREALGTSQLNLPEGPLPKDVAALRCWLSERHGAAFAEAMADPNVICAVNQEVVDDTRELRSGDEVAFFPPVTGG